MTGLSHERAQKLYDGTAGALLRLGSLASLHEPLLGRLFQNREFKLPATGAILDVGTGNGQILNHLLEHTVEEVELFALDASTEMLRRARARALSPRVTYVQGSVERLPFRDGALACITCGWVIEHLADPQPGLQEMSRVLQPGGRLLLLATEDTWQGAIVGRTWNVRTFQREELRAECERAGLPWHREIWFSRLHELLHWGGIVVEAIKPAPGHKHGSSIT
jgi:ubiquinone/menaquinone biosynthesis C-methylase UbiE